MAATYTTIAIVGNNNDYNKVLEELYNHFNGTSTKWQLKVAATHAPASSAAGDQGFILESIGAETANIVFGTQAYYGAGVAAYHEKAVSGYLASGDQLIIGIDPGGTTTDMTTGSFTVGARWSGWVVDQQGESSGSVSSKVRVIEDDDYIALVFYDSGEAQYDSGCFVGKMEVVAAKASGYCILGGDVDNWASYSLADEGAYEAFSAQGIWAPLRAWTSNGGGFSGAGADDGFGSFEITKIPVANPQVPASSNETNWSFIGVLPCFFTGPSSGTIGEAWDNGVSTIGYNFDGGCYIFADDGVTAW